MEDYIRLLLNGPQPDDIGNAFLQARNASIAERQGQEDRANRLAYQSQSGQLIAHGKYKEAGALALAHGDTKGGEAFIALDKNTTDQANKSSEVLSNIVNAVGTLPYEQRRSAIMSAKPTLMRLGIGAADIDNFDPSDQNIQALGHSGYSYGQGVKDQTEQYRADTGRIEALNPKVVGNSLVTPGGTVLFRDEQYISTPLGNDLFHVPGTQSQGYTSQTLGPDQAFANMLQAESGGKQFTANGQTVTSNKGALGIAQLMPATARDAARMAGVEFDENRLRNDPAYNQQLGRAYYDSLVKRYGGDVEKAAAAYNSGMGRVDSAMARGGENWRNYLPAETRGYIAKVVGQSRINIAPELIRAGTRDPNSGDSSNQPKSLSEKDMANARTKLSQVRRLKSQVMKMQELDRAGIYGGMIGGRVPGNTPLIGAGSSDRYDALLANVRNTVGAITRIPGIGAQSDYEARLAAATMPERTRSKEGRDQSYQELWALAIDMERELDAQANGTFGRASQPQAQQPQAQQPQRQAPAQSEPQYEYRTLPDGSRQRRLKK